MLNVVACVWQLALQPGKPVLELCKNACTPGKSIAGGSTRPTEELAFRGRPALPAHEPGVL
jgi:hypothetical protein